MQGHASGFPDHGDTDLNRALILYPELDLKKVRLIGWGATSPLFSEHFPSLGLKLAYTIHPLKRNWGKIIHGVEVRPPSALENEDPANTLIIVFSDWWFDIYRQIAREHGKWKVIRAFGGWSDRGSTLWNALGQRKSRERVRKDVAVVIQGPLSAYTPLALRISNKFVDAPIILSTWATEDRTLLEKCRKFVDFVVQSEMPDHDGPGGMNLIRQQKGVLAGLEVARKEGFHYVMKSRTDTSIYMEDGGIDSLIAGARRDGESSVGLKKRILFHGADTWKYVPYHLTDQHHFGVTEDLINYWSFDESIGLSAIALDEPFHFFALCTPEAQICRSFLARNGLGHSKKYANLSCSSYWRLARKEFGLMPESSVDFVKWKGISLSAKGFGSASGLAEDRLNDTMTASWLNSIGEKELERAEKLMDLGMTVANFFANEKIAW